MISAERIIHAERNSAVSGWTRIADGELWRWKWGDWTSPAFPYLEERPWTPVVVAERLCFTAHREDLGWCVVWGDEIGRWYDDVYDIAELSGVPIYIARDDTDYFLAWGRRTSQRFPHQITYTLDQGSVQIQEFSPVLGRTGAVIAARWSPADESS